MGGDDGDRERLERERNELELDALRRKTPLEIRKLERDASRFPPTVVATIVAAVISALVAGSIGYLGFVINTQNGRLEEAARFQSAATAIGSPSAQSRIGAAAALKLHVGAKDQRAPQAIALLVSATNQEEDPTVLDVLIGALTAANSPDLFPQAVRANRRAVTNLRTAIYDFDEATSIAAAAAPAKKSEFDALVTQFDPTFAYPNDRSNVQPAKNGQRWLPNATEDLISAITRPGFAIDSIPPERPVIPKGAESLSRFAKAFAPETAALTVMILRSLVHPRILPDSAIPHLAQSLRPKAVAVVNSSALLTNVVNRLDAASFLADADLHGTAFAFGVSRADLRRTNLSESVLFGIVADSDLESANLTNVLGSRLLIIGGSLNSARVARGYIALDAHARCIDNKGTPDRTNTLPTLTDATLEGTFISPASPGTETAVPNKDARFLVRHLSFRSSSPDSPTISQSDAAQLQAACNKSDKDVTEQRI